MMPITIRQVQVTSTSTDSRLIVVLPNGTFLIRTCPRSQACSDSCQSATAGASPLPTQDFAKVFEEAGRPQYRAGMSRGGDWADAVVSLESDGSVDFADVFRGGRARAIRFRLCPTAAGTRCDGAYLTVNWTGQTAKTTSPAFTPGLYNMVEDDAQSDAWVRIVAWQRARDVRAEYDAALDVVRTWVLPESTTPLPSLDRLSRPILATVGDAP